MASLIEKYKPWFLQISIGWSTVDWAQLTGRLCSGIMPNPDPQGS
jgi:hypothetical protein